MRGTTGVLTLLALLLSGCASAAEPSSLKTPSPESPPASTGLLAPSPTESSTPEPKSGPKEDVLAFMDEYMRLAERSLSSEAALEERRQSFSESCQVCASGWDVAASILRSGLSVEGGSIEWTGEVIDIAPGGTRATVQVTRSLGPVVLRDDDGLEVQRAEASGPTTEIYQLTRDDGGNWLVVSIKRLP